MSVAGVVVVVALVAYVVFITLNMARTPGARQTLFVLGGALLVAIVAGVLGAARR